MEKENETLVETPVAAPEVPAKKHGKIGGIIALVVVLLLVVGGLATFIMITTSPKSVFTKAINESYKEVELTFKDLEKIENIFDFKEHAITLEGEAKVASNVSEVLEDYDLKEMELSFNGKVGFDYKNELIQVEGKVKGTKEEIDAKAFLQENGVYLKTSLYDKLIKLTDDLGDEFDFKDLKKQLDRELGDVKLDAKLYEDIAASAKDALIKSLDKEAMSKTSAKYTVIEKEVKATKYTYTIDSKAAQKLSKEFISNLLKDKDFVKKLAEAAGVEKDEVEDQLKNLKEEAKNIELPEKIKISVYTYGLLNKLGGFEIAAGKEEILTYLTDGDNYRIEVNGSEKTVITAEKSGKEHKLVVKEGKEKVLTGTIRELSRTKVDMDIDAKEADAKLNILVTEKIEKDKVSGEIKFKVTHEDEYVSLEGKYALEALSGLEKAKASDAVDVEEVDEEKLTKNIEEKVKNDEVLNAIYEAAKDEMEMYKARRTPITDCRSSNGEYTDNCISSEPIIDDYPYKPVE